jgi:hypothetical protein
VTTVWNTLCHPAFDLTHLLKCTSVLRHGGWTVACCNGHIPAAIYTEKTLHNPESSQIRNKLCSVTAPSCLTDRSCLHHCSNDGRSLLLRLNWIAVGHIWVAAKSVLSAADAAVSVRPSLPAHWTQLQIVSSVTQYTLQGLENSKTIRICPCACHGDLTCGEGREGIIPRFLYFGTRLG